VLEGSIERVTFHTAENASALLRIKRRGHRDLVRWWAMPPKSVLANGDGKRHLGEHREHGSSSKAPSFRCFAPTTAEGIEKLTSARE